MAEKVVTWTMSEQERLDYIKKHPIVKTERPTGVHDYKWRSEKGTEARLSKNSNTAK